MTPVRAQNGHYIDAASGTAVGDSATPVAEKQPSFKVGVVQFLGFRPGLETRGSQGAFTPLEDEKQEPKAKAGGAEEAKAEDAEEAEAKAEDAEEAKPDVAAAAEEEAPVANPASAPTPTPPAASSALPPAGATLPLLPAGGGSGPCCAPANAATFLLRTGPNYKKNKKKAASGPALYDLVGCDVLNAPSKLGDIAERVDLAAMRPSHYPAAADAAAGGAGCPVPPLLLVNAQVPYTTKGGGAGCSVAFYFALSAAAASDVLGKDPAHWSAGLRLWRAYVERCGGGGGGDAKFQGRLKAMGIVENIEALGFGSMVNGYNGKPTLITKSGQLAPGSRPNGAGAMWCWEMAVDVSQFNWVARKSLCGPIMSKISAAAINVGFTVEGRDDGELPEQILGCAVLSKVDLKRDAKPLLASPT